MNGEKRRKSIIAILEKSSCPISGETLAEVFAVSRQVIVQDIALLRASDCQITATNRGYLLAQAKAIRRVFKVQHTDAQMEEELNMIVDNGGRLLDVFIFHRIYGLIRADLSIKSRLDVHNFMDEISTGKSFPLKNVTSGYHYHTILADDEKTLDLIHEKLGKAGFLAKLGEYEPIDI